MTTHLLTGEAGEGLAEGFLAAKGYQLIERNWRCRSGEIDLIMLDEDVLVFIEVKTRRNRNAGAAEESVSPQKSARLLASGEWYVSEHAEHDDRVWRIDIVAVTMGQGDDAIRVTHMQNAVTSG